MCSRHDGDSGTRAQAIYVGQLCQAVAKAPFYDRIGGNYLYTVQPGGNIRVVELIAGSDYARGRGENHTNAYFRKADTNCG